MIFKDPLPKSNALRDAVRASIRIDEERCVDDLLDQIRLTKASRERIGRMAIRLVEAVRSMQPGQDGLDAFLHEYELSSREGVVLMCLADNAGFKLGNGVTGDEHVAPTVVAGLRDARSLGAGDNHTCVIVDDTGRIQCWGQNQSGQLGAPPPLGSAKPVVVSFEMVSTLEAVEVAAGRAHTCARTNYLPGVVLCWGANEQCQLGVGDCNPGDQGYRALSATPVGVSAPQNLGAVRELALGGDDTCVLLDDGVAACWGDNGAQQLCTAGPNKIVNGQPLPPVGEVTAVTHSGTLGCTASGASVQCCGLGGSGPFDVGAPVDDLSAGDAHVCGLADSRVFCGGSNEHGQLGQGHFDPVNNIVEVAGLPPIAQIEAGARYSCALATTGDIFCWGDNTRGQVDPGVNVTALAVPSDAVGKSVGCVAPPL